MSDGLFNVTTPERKLMLAILQQTLSELLYNKRREHHKKNKPRKYTYTKLSMESVKEKEAREPMNYLKSQSEDDWSVRWLLSHICEHVDGAQTRLIKLAESIQAGHKLKVQKRRAHHGKNMKKKYLQ